MSLLMVVPKLALSGDLASPHARKEKGMVGGTQKLVRATPRVRHLAYTSSLKGMSLHEPADVRIAPPERWSRPACLLVPERALPLGNPERLTPSMLR